MVKVAVQEDLKRPASAYWLWLSANRDKITKLAGTAKGSVVSKKGGEMWKLVSDAEKKPFEEQAKQQKEKYDAYVKTPEGQAGLQSLKEDRKGAKVEDVKKQQRIAAKHVEKDERLKKPTSAYWLWLNANRDKITKAAGTAKGSEVSKKGGEMWKLVGDAEKKPFEEQAKQQKEKYDAFLKTPEGEAAMQEFKGAQSSAKADVKGANLLAEPDKKRKAKDGEVDEDGEAGEEDAGEDEADKEPTPKKAKTESPVGSDVESAAKALGYFLKLKTLLEKPGAKGKSAGEVLEALKAANGSTVAAKKALGGA